VNILLVTDTFPPMRTSGAEHMYALAKQLLLFGHQVTVIIPNPHLLSSVKTGDKEQMHLVEVKTLTTKDTHYVFRTFAEFINPLLIKWRLRHHQQFLDSQFDGVVWYSPTIFWGPLITFIKRHFRCPSYLVLRDFFPDWAVHLGLLSSKGLPFWFLKKVEAYQYAQADTIGIQSPNNLRYFQQHYSAVKAHLEVLWNWGFADPDNTTFVAGTINADLTPNYNSSRKKAAWSLAAAPLFGRTIFVYAGNMGVAQGMESILELMAYFSARSDVGFLMVGRGSEVQTLRNKVDEFGWHHVEFLEEVSLEEIHLILAQCHIGLIFLDPRHQTHNIPGKLISYLKAGLPILAYVNPGNDLETLIPDAGIGRVCFGDGAMSHRSLLDEAQAVLQDSLDPKIKERAIAFGQSLFSVAKAAEQITHQFAAKQ
jgi:glycosyltransferase involved in cell wall biosynthesis